MRRRKLRYVGLMALAILLAANWVVASLHIKYWRPDERFWRINLYAYHREGVKADILMFGSSRTQAAIVPPVVERQLSGTPTSPSAYNLGQAFGNTLKNAIILGDIVRSGACPSVIVLEVSPGLLNGGNVQNSFLADYASFADLPLLAPYLGSPGRLDAFLTGSLSGLVGLYYNAVHPPPPARIRGALVRGGGRWGRRSPGTDRGVSARAIRRRHRAAERFMMRRYLRDFTLEGLPSRALESIVRIASDCGAKLVLVRVPTVVPIARPRLRAIELEFQGYMEAFSRRTGVPFHDISRDDVGLLPEHYRDFSHLNYDGAKLYSRFLGRAILLPALAESGS